MGFNRIKKNFFLSIVNVFLRLSVTFGKFVLLIYIAKYFTTEDLGIYGLFTTSIALAIILMGIDFYNFSHREILNDRSNVSKYLYNQFIFHIVCYLLSIPLTFLLSHFRIIPNHYLSFFLIILVLEHLSQEFYRIFIILKKPVIANLIFFIRSGLWTYLIVFLWLFNIFPKDLSTVWLMWFMSVFFSVILSVVELSKIGVLKKESLDWEWIVKGIKTGLFFFIGTLCYKVIEFSDRYMIDVLLSKSAVGIYTFYVNIANLVNTVVFTSVIIFYYPRLFEYMTQGKDEYRIIVKKFFLSTLIVSLVSIFIILILIYPIISIINKVEYLENIKVFYIMLIANVILNLSFIPHYVLYAMKKERIIVYSTVVASFVNIILNIFLIKKLGILGAGISTLISFTIIAMFKSLGGLKLEKNIDFLRK
jgi:O-antigen/teichoic acid export membrane protein